MEEKVATGTRVYADAFGVCCEGRRQSLAIVTQEVMTSLTHHLDESLLFQGKIHLYKSIGSAIIIPIAAINEL